MASDGEEYAEVTAKDFVNGLKHAADKKSKLYLAETSVKVYRLFDRVIQKFLYSRY